MPISILIPVYNRNVIPLVTALQRQGIESGVPFDILVADDASDNSLITAGNADLGRMPHVRYHVFKENLGAHRVRNEMAVLATYPHLLLIDSDAEVTDEQYFARYAALADGKTVAFGGIAYSPAPRRDNLRWWYGVHRECAPADQYNRRPGGFLTTFNLLIPRDVFLAGADGELPASTDDLPVSDHISGYGHEDTLLGMQLERDGVQVLHINNPLLHAGLPDNETFLRQTENAVANLWVLYRSFEPLALLRKRSKLIRMYEWLRRLGLLGVYAAWFSRNESAIRGQLLSNAPSLRKMDMYKLGMLVRYARAGR